MGTRKTALWWRCPWAGLFIAITIAIVAAASYQSGTTRAAYEAVDSQPPEPHVVARDAVAAGRYLVQIGGCNDCHTQDFLQKGTEVPESEWLKGSTLGWRGPWGTTYGANLRAVVQIVDEDAFVKMMHAGHMRPPHPSASIGAMSEPDLRAIYTYVKTLQPVGDPAPAYVGPGREPKPPYFLLDPDLAAKAAAAAGSTGGDPVQRR